MRVLALLTVLPSLPSKQPVRVVCVCVFWILCAILGIPESATLREDADDARRPKQPRSLHGLRRGLFSAPDRVGQSTVVILATEKAALAANSN